MKNAKSQISASEARYSEFLFGLQTKSTGRVSMSASESKKLSGQLKKQYNGGRK